MIRFIHIPKTAGTSVVNWMTKNNITFKLGRYSEKKGYTKTHSTALFWKNKYPKKETYMFSVVRNPYTRLVSYYRYIKKVDPNFLLTWDEFVDTKYNLFDFHFPWTTQIHYVGDKKNNIIVNKIIYFENLENDLQHFFKIYKQLPSKNVTNSTNIDYMNTYYKCNNLKSIVEEHFKIDFDTFYSS